jgi:hypothetical protein
MMIVFPNTAEGSNDEVSVDRCDNGRIAFIVCWTPTAVPTEFGVQSGPFGSNIDLASPLSEALQNASSRLKCLRVLRRRPRQSTKNCWALAVANTRMVVTIASEWPITQESSLGVCLFRSPQPAQGDPDPSES